MPDIPIHNETDYDLTATILDQIKRDALEYFGDSIRVIRVQYGIERHAFNARTGEMRYAFSPTDFGMVDAMTFFADSYPSRDVPSIDDEADEVDEADDIVDEADFDDVEVDDEAAVATSLESLREDLDDTDDDRPDGFQSVDHGFDELEDDDKEFLYEDDDDYS